MAARNMSEDMRKKMSNAVANQAAGLGENMHDDESRTPKPKPAAAVATPATTATAASITVPAASTTGGTSWARPYGSAKKATTSNQAAEENDRMLVTIRDAMFVMERERGHDGGTYTWRCVDLFGKSLGNKYVQIARCIRTR